MKKITLAIEGMTCSSCSNGLEKYLNKYYCYIEFSKIKKSIKQRSS